MGRKELNGADLPHTNIEAGEEANVDKIRDILFGTQMRDIDGRFSHLEETIRKESAELRDTVRKRLDAFETFFKKELESQDQLIKREREERTSTLSQTNRDLKEANAALLKRASDAEDRATASQRDLRQDLLAQVKSLFDDIAAKELEWGSLLDRRVGELRKEKVDRSALANMLNELSLRLTNEFTVPLSAKGKSGNGK